MEDFKKILSGKIEFSKKVIVAIVATWIILLIGAGLSEVFLGVNIEFILPYSQTAMVSGVIAYLLKSTVEGYGKIVNWGNPNDNSNSKG